MKTSPRSSLEVTLPVNAADDPTTIGSSAPTRQPSTQTAAEATRTEARVVLTRHGVRTMFISSLSQHRWGYSGAFSIGAILIQRENPALPAKDERSDAQSEPRTEQGGSESRKLW